ncbi:hypothetical protein [uncultured Pelagimonas sp.]|uniref:hypothetical protein n=1 Tax=uncultured Pelagimonas sp. TaxID=1618102 RepID=UPI0026369936|nr:hypothetical protein [uncultured Pelagimonas sp.]
MAVKSKGKWSEAGVPHKGWTCDDVEDLGDDRRICEMCRTQEIRYVHYMSHREYDQVLACGCDCAGHMEGNLTRADKRDHAMRNASARRQNFPNLKSWKRSRNGNSTIVKAGKRVTVFKNGETFKFVVNHPLLPDGKFGRKSFETEREAKLAAFDAGIWLEQNLSKFLE